MTKDKHGETFRVIDRRLFNEEGQLRQEIVEQEQTHEAKPQTAPEPNSVQPAAAPAAPVTPPKSNPMPAGSPPTAEAPKTSRNFRMLLGLLANQAEACLGGAPDPVTGQAFLDLQGARTIIDIFDDLIDRTRGNLAPEDHKVLLDIIGSLKVTYLEMEKVAAQMAAQDAAGAPPAGSRGKR